MSEISKLLLPLCPWENEFNGKLAEDSLTLFPFYQTVSRLKYKPDAFECKLISDPIEEIVKLPYDNSTYAQSMDRRARELADMNVNTYVMYSGGIDSTGLLVSIYRNWTDEELERLTVFYNTDSVKENPNFFKHISQKKTKTKITTLNLEPYLKDGIVVTGELGDQLMGSDIVGDCVAKFGEESIRQDWTTVAPKFFESVAPNGLLCYEKYKGIINESPFELKNTHDFFWWLNFTQKWQHVKLRLLVADVWKEQETTFKNIVHFYETPYFQVWSLHNHHLKIKNTWDSYKFTAKEYILDYTKDVSYMSKRKINSLNNVFLGREFNWSIDENWKFLSKEETLERVKWH